MKIVVPKLFLCQKKAPLMSQFISLYFINNSPKIIINQLNMMKQRCFMCIAYSMHLVKNK